MFSDTLRYLLDPRLLGGQQLRRCEGETRTRVLCPVVLPLKVVKNSKPQQHLSVEAQIAFSARFGQIELLGKHYDEKFAWASNQRKDGTIYEKDTHQSQILRGNEGWHTDSSYMMLAAKASVLSAHVVPSQGGQTEWADWGPPTMPRTKQPKRKLPICPSTIRLSNPKPGSVML